MTRRRARAHVRTHGGGGGAGEARGGAARARGSLVVTLVGQLATLCVAVFFRRIDPPIRCTGVRDRRPRWVSLGGRNRDIGRLVR